MVRKSTYTMVCLTSRRIALWWLTLGFNGRTFADQIRTGTRGRALQQPTASLSVSVVSSENGESVTHLFSNTLLNIINTDVDPSLLNLVVGSDSALEFVRFRLTNGRNGEIVNAREGRAPFAFCGDRGGNYRPCGVGVIEEDTDYTLEILPGGDEEWQWQTYNFRLQGVEPAQTTMALPPQPELQAPIEQTQPAVAPSVSGKLVRFQLIDANTNEVLETDLLDGTVLSAKEGDLWNIEAVPLHEDVVFVKFSNGHREGRRPYSLCGDQRGTFDACEDLHKTGDHSFAVTLIAPGNERLARVYLDIRTIGAELINGKPGDISTEDWSILDDDASVTARHEACFVWVDQKGYLIGGRRKPTTDIFDPETNTWTNAGALPPLALHHMQCIVVDREIWIVSAWTGSYPREKTTKEM